MTLHQIAENYPKHVRTVFKHYPLSFHANADIAHMASVAAQEQGKFFEMHDKLFGLGASAKPAPFTREIVVGFAKEIGLDMKKFEAALSREESLVREAVKRAAAELTKTWDLARVTDPAGANTTQAVRKADRATFEKTTGEKTPGAKISWATVAEQVQKVSDAVNPVSRGKIASEVNRALFPNLQRGMRSEFDTLLKKELGVVSQIDEDMAAMEKLLGNFGTPTFIVNGQVLKGAKPYDEFRKIIDAELKKKGIDPPATAGNPPNPKYAVPGQAAEPAKPSEPKVVGEVPIGRSPFQGAKDAPVVVTEASDFQ